MEIIFEARSTNGRYGVQVLSQSPLETCFQGTLVHKGKVEHKDVFLAVPDTSIQNWVLLLHDQTTCLSGASEVWQQSLQSGSYASILVLGPQAIVKTIGYKGRSSAVHLYHEGRKRDVPAAVLLVMGLIESSTEILEVKPPPPVESPIAEALRRAGIII